MDQSSLRELMRNASRALSNVVSDAPALAINTAVKHYAHVYFTNDSAAINAAAAGIDQAVDNAFSSSDAAFAGGSEFIQHYRVMNTALLESFPDIWKQQLRANASFEITDSEQIYSYIKTLYPEIAQMKNQDGIKKALFDVVSNHRGYYVFQELAKVIAQELSPPKHPDHAAHLATQYTNSMATLFIMLEPFLAAAPVVGKSESPEAIFDRLGLKQQGGRQVD